MLSDQWTIPEFYPMDWLPNGAPHGLLREAADLTAAVLPGFLDAVAAGDAVVPIGRTYQLDQIVQAHQDLEANRTGGKAVVLLEANP